jgi:hypothetical protein
MGCRWILYAQEEKLPIQKVRREEKVCKSHFWIEANQKVTWKYTVDMTTDYCTLSSFKKIYHKIIWSFVSLHKRNTLWKLFCSLFISNLFYKRWTVTWILKIRRANISEIPVLYYDVFVSTVVYYSIHVLFFCMYLYYTRSRMKFKWRKYTVCRQMRPENPPTLRKIREFWYCYN